MLSATPSFLVLLLFAFLGSVVWSSPGLHCASEQDALALLYVACHGDELCRQIYHLGAINIEASQTLLRHDARRIGLLQQTGTGEAPLAHAVWRSANTAAGFAHANVSTPLYVTVGTTEGPGCTMAGQSLGVHDPTLVPHMLALLHQLAGYHYALRVDAVRCDAPNEVAIFDPLSERVFCQCQEGKVCEAHGTANDLLFAVSYVGLVALIVVVGAVMIYASVVSIRRASSLK